ncbi:MAG: hypothetical protein M0Q53_06355 [Prolixibacteraceae bacterium]|jgi:hypothetical protein|nr:hypothetical protein [Prolixibacteraceae bacterium]
MKNKSEHIEKEPRFPKMESGYTVPEGYFESFGERLNFRMQVESQSKPVKSMMVYMRPALGIAAGLAIFLTLYLHPFGSQKQSALGGLHGTGDISAIDLTDAMVSTYTSLASDVQFFSSLSEMDEFDASRISKDGLADYLVSNCSDFEILNTNK